MSEMNECEKKFKDWLDHKQYPYFYIEQSLGTFSSLFRNVTKRPDFFVLIESIGFIAVDVKEREIQKEYETLILDETKDIQKLTAFERMFRIPVWFALSSSASVFKTWYWISLYDVIEKVEVKRGSKGRFRAIPLTATKTIGWEDNLGKLFG
ncbi:MAG: hypothetical protein ACFFCD_03660 [Promethearchaeota archaeon]